MRVSIVVPFLNEAEALPDGLTDADGETEALADPDGEIDAEADPLGLMLALGFYWPALASGAGRVATITIVTLALGAVTYRGIQQSARLVNALTVAKLVPLAIFVLAGLWHVEPARLVPYSGVSLDQALTAGLLLIFAFGGFDVIAVPAGEAADPRRDVPVAFVATIAVVATVYVLAQVVASGTLPDLAASSTPLADSAQLTIGASGALMISLGSIFAMSGNIAGQVLAGSRYLFALAEQGDLPRWFARVHPRFHTPANATIFTTVVTLARRETLYCSLDGTGRFTAFGAH